MELGQRRLNRVVCEAMAAPIGAWQQAMRPAGVMEEMRYDAPTLAISGSVDIRTLCRRLGFKAVGNDERRTAADRGAERRADQGEQGKLPRSAGFP
jgi:hypothetical protein